MKYVRQLLIILAISFAGEVLHAVLPLPVPASIYGLVLMLVLLMTGILKLHHVRETALFLIDIMPLLFIPAGVGLITAWPVLKPILLPTIIITLIVTLVVMAVTGHVTQAVIRLSRRQNHG